MKLSTCKPVVRVLASVLAFACIAAAADAPKLTFKFSKVNVPGALQTFVQDLNNKGVMVGQYEDSNSNPHGYILNGKKLTTVDDPKGTPTGVTGINFNGAINVVGFYRNFASTVMGFRYNPRTNEFKDIPSPKGAKCSIPIDVNDQGWIVGYYSDSDNNCNSNVHGFLLQGKKYTTLDVPSAVATYAYGINNQGNISLTWVDSSNAYEGSFYNYTDKTYTTINVPGAGSLGSEALHMNNEDDIAFWWFDFGGNLHSALCTKCDSTDRKYYKFDKPKAIATGALGINDKNAVVGQWQDVANGPVSSFEATFK